MREKLNDNPVVQIAVIGVLALIVGFMLLRALSGPKAGTEQPDLGVTPAQDADAAAAAAPAAVAGAATPAPAQDPAAAQGPATSAPASGPAAGGSDNGSAFVAGPGLPRKVAAAYRADKVIALLIVRGPAIDDRRLVPMVASLSSRKDTAVFITKAFDIARYSRIVQGVKVERTPALVVVQPQHLTRGPLPTATVSYGYRGKQTVEQQVRDALYKGRANLPYYPHD